MKKIIVTIATATVLGFAVDISWCESPKIPAPTCVNVGCIPS